MKDDVRANAEVARGEGIAGGSGTEAREPSRVTLTGSAVDAHDRHAQPTKKAVEARARKPQWQPRAVELRDSGLSWAQVTARLNADLLTDEENKTKGDDPQRPPIHKRTVERWVKEAKNQRQSA